MGARKEAKKTRQMLYEMRQADKAEAQRDERKAAGAGLLSFVAEVRRNMHEAKIKRLGKK